MENPSDRETSALVASNEYLNREVARLESERDALERELRRVTGGYGWKVIGAYRRWLVRHKANPLVKFCEWLTMRMLARSYGEEEQDPERRYQKWIAAQELTPERLDAIAEAMAGFAYRPLISVCIAAPDDTNDQLVRAAVDSMRSQLHDHWELCVEGGKQTHSASDPDARIVERPSSASEFAVFLPPDGAFSRDALFAVVQQLNRYRDADLIYWDEDRLGANAARYAAFFKPDWSPDLILSTNYIGRSFAVRRSLVDAIDSIGSNGFDLVLRACERARAIIHIAKILYHAREAESPANDTHAVEAALRRQGIGAKVETSKSGSHFVRYEIRDHPMVSVLIPTRDRLELLQKCIESILGKTDYDNYEIIILDNDSGEPDTLRYFEQMRDKVRVVRCPGPFNFSAINNRGVAEARGHFIVFLNNDTEVIRPDWMRALLEHAQRPEVGAVGAKLLFPDGRIQHAGVVLGIEGTVAHAFRLMPSDSPMLANVVRNCSAVTAACMMMRRSLFEEVGRLDEALPIDYNDIDLCLRLRRRGLLIVYTPLALLYHHESASRQPYRSQPYRELFMSRWGRDIMRGDPYYNRNLTLARDDWSVAI